MTNFLIEKRQLMYRLCYGQNFFFHFITDLHQTNSENFKKISKLISVIQLESDQMEQMAIYAINGQGRLKEASVVLEMAYFLIENYSILSSALFLNS